MPSPSIDHLKAIHAAAAELLKTHATYKPLLDDPPAIIDGATAHWCAVAMALAQLEPAAQS